MELWEHQTDIIEGVRAEMKKGVKRILAVAPTGGGKTVMFSYIAKKSISNFNRVLIISHRIELLTQAGGTLSEFGLYASVIDSKTKNPPIGGVFVAMTGTLKNRISKQKEWLDWWSKISIIIIDEAHRGEFGWITEFEEGKIKLGFTATAKRSGKMRQLIDEYDVMVQKVDVQDLINKNKLLPDRYFGVPFDISGVKIDRDGEYNSDDLYSKFSKAEIYDGLISNIKKHAPNEVTIVFCCNIKHAIETCVKLNDSGFRARFVTSKPTKDKELYEKYYNKYSGDREAMVSGWKNGDFEYLVNAGIFVEGFDHKATQCVILNLATTSDNKFLQMVGRGARISDGKKYFKLLDFGANADRLGHYRAERKYSLLHKVSDGSGLAPYKDCPKCGAIIFSSSKFCKYCGYEFISEKQTKSVELEERIYLDPLEKEAEENNRSQFWVWRQIWIKGGDNALRDYAKKKGYHPLWYKQQTKRYKI